MDDELKNNEYKWKTVQVVLEGKILDIKEINYQTTAGEYNPISVEDRVKHTQAFNHLLSRSIAEFCEQNKIPKSKFAEALGVRPSHLSSILSRNRDVDYLQLQLAYQCFGCLLDLEMNSLGYRFKFVKAT